MGAGNAARKTILLMSTGGTIASRYDPVAKALISVAGGDELLAAMGSLAPDVNIIHEAFSNVGSSLLLWGVMTDFSKQLLIPGREASSFKVSAAEMPRRRSSLRLTEQPGMASSPWLRLAVLTGVCSRSTVTGEGEICRMPGLFSLAVCRARKPASSYARPSPTSRSAILLTSSNNSADSCLHRSWCSATTLAKLSMRLYCRLEPNALVCIGL